jgi:fatty-acyl-CoA synthase
MNSKPRLLSRETLGDCFWAYVEASPTEPALQCRDLGGTERSLTREALGGEVRRRIAGLTRAGVQRGDRVVIALETSVEFIALFWALQSLGAAVAPVAAATGRGRQASLQSHLRKVCEIVDPALVIVERDGEEIAGVAPVATAAALDHDGSGQDGSGDGSGQDVLANHDADQLAVLQFTSGSTAHPRGCALTHRAIIANARAIGERVKARAGDVSVSWLPLHHDMGLMTGVTLPVVVGVGVRLRPPARFVANPMSWLEDLAAYPRSHTAVPNFALALVLQRLGRRPPERLDLSGVVTLVCGSEPIDPALAQAFLEALAPYGLAAEAFHPAYGMAEATLMITSRGGGLAIRDLKTDPLAKSHGFVNLGRPLSGVDIRIVGEDGSTASSDQIGEIHLRSPSLMMGYFRDPQASEKALGSGWLATGDLGFTHGEELFVVGRLKEMIIVAGRNIYPTDIEYAVARATGLLPSRVAAVSGPRFLGTETIHLFLEARAGQDPESLTQAARLACLQVCNLAPAGVSFLEAGAIPRTTSGKIRRGALRERLLHEAGSA